MQIFYDLIFFLFLWIYLPYFFIKRKYHREFIQRMGFFPKDYFGDISHKKTIWIHAVSVGEVNAGIPLWKALREKYLAYKIVFSTVTKTGNHLAKRFASPNETVFYFPLDLSFVVKRVLNLIKPSLLIILETELWPNFILQCYKLKIPVILVNARISDRAYQRYILVKFFLKPIFKRVSLVLAQSNKDRERFINLGMEEKKVFVTGNMKFDVEYKDRGVNLDNLRGLLKEKDKLLVAGSIHRGEEKVIVFVYKELFRLFPHWKLLIAPRYLERVGEIERLIKRIGFSPVRISSLIYQSPTDYQNPIFILDTIGQLRDFYALADIVFVGGSLIKKGGHNIIEPALFSKPIISGRYFFNFSDIFKKFLENNALIICKNKEELKRAIEKLIKNPEEREKMGMRAKEVMEREKGVVEKNLKHIISFLN